jgi:hypothetical protein
MHNSDDPHSRGKDFEGFINWLFGLFDLEPRAAYSLDREQIDGAFRFRDRQLLRQPHFVV